jgi:polysaccharide export outer membrane protein
MSHHKRKQKNLIRLMLVIATHLLALPIALTEFTSEFASALPLSAGDRVRLLIPDGDLFNGVYTVNADGTILIPYLEPLLVEGNELAVVQVQIREQLIRQKYFQPDFLQVSLTPLALAPIAVNVVGATFQPGRVLINNRPMEQLTQSSGDYAPERFLTAALRGAGGVLPNADVTRIKVVRRQETVTVDLSGVFSGAVVNDIPLVAGDTIIVPQRKEIDPRIVRPSQITPPGITVFLSNLSRPADSNSQSGVNKDATSLPYGARFSQAVFAANCVGGINTTNAHRRAVLVRVDRESGETFAIDRTVEELVRDSKNNQTNPFLMPQDSVACYDATVTEVRDVFSAIGDVLNPVKLIRDIFNGNSK